MADPYMLREMVAVKAAIGRLAPELQRLQEHREEATRVALQIDAVSARLPSHFETAVLQDRTDTYLRELVKVKAPDAYVREMVKDRAPTHAVFERQLADDQVRMRAQIVEDTARIKRNQKDSMLVSVALPKRGWYLSGREPCTLTNRLASAINQDRWDKVDQQMMDNLPVFKIGPLRAWLRGESIPEHAINRLCRFLKHHDAGNYEESTFLGVPLLDEIAKHLYGGKTFTTKRSGQRRSDQSKPELAFRTVSGPQLERYCESFVQAFGSLQEDPQKTRLADENYWNRHAIVHGMIERATGVKDSAKCLMAISFLIFARKEKNPNR